MIVTCDPRHLFARCKERGYSLQEVLPCVVRETNNLWDIDTAHPAYPKEMRTPQKAVPFTTTPPPPPNYGPGTELKKMLAKIGIRASPTCSCNKRAAIMDEKGIDWCKDNTDKIVGWLREESTKRGLPFVDLAGKLLVRRAISLAEKAEKKRKQREAQEENTATDG